MNGECCHVRSRTPDEKPRSGVYVCVLHGAVERKQKARWWKWEKADSASKVAQKSKTILGMGVCRKEKNNQDAVKHVGAAHSKPLSIRMQRVQRISLVDGDDAHKSLMTNSSSSLKTGSSADGQ